MDKLINDQKVESFASVSSAIMMKIPTNNLTSLRTCFESKPDGLGLDDFLVAVVSNMELLDYSEMMLMVADLIDFFHLVDINGDGHMEWEEFVMFILDCVVQEKLKKKEELLQHVITRQVQSAAIRNPVISSMTVPVLGKYLMGVGLHVQIYGPDERSLPSKTSLIYTINLIGSEKPLTQYLPGEKLITVLDMSYLEAFDILCILRSDMSLEFIKFLSRSNYSFETIDHIGKVDLDVTCHKIAWRVLPNNSARLLAVGPTSEIHHWLFAPHGEHGTAELKDHRIIEKHKDFIRDILIINNEMHRYVITASLDKSIIIWDFQTLEYISCRTGHNAGVECLSYNGKNLLFSGGYDYLIIVWDLETTINRPLYTMYGHTSCITKIVSIDSIDRCCSLDENGTFIWWDIAKNIPQNTMPKNNLSTERFIESWQVPEDRARTFDLFSHLPYTYQCLYGVMVLSAGRRQHIYHCKDCSIQESPPVCVLYSPDLLSIYTVHTHDIIFWSGVNGYSYKTINDLISIHSKMTCGMLDDRKRRMILGDTNGYIRYYNCLNGVLLKTYPPATHAIKTMIYSPDKTLIVLLDSSDLYIYDDTVDTSMSNNGTTSTSTSTSASTSANHHSTDHILREMRIPITTGSFCSDIVCITYCYPLGLIATVDIMGLLILWDYTYFTPEIIIPHINGGNGDVCRLEFIPGYPILVIVDTTKQITLLSCKTLSSNKDKIQLWRLEPQLDSTIIHSLEVDEMKQNEENEEEDIDGAMGAKAKLFTFTKAKLFLKRITNTIERMVIHISTSTSTSASATTSSTTTNNASTSSTTSTSDNLQDPNISSSSSSSSSGTLFPNNILVQVICGYKDGTITVTDITKTLQIMNIGPIIHEDYIQYQIGYTSRSKSIRTLSDIDMKKILNSEEILSILSYSSCSIQYIWKPHLNAIVSLSIVGEYNWLLTASDDCSVQLWTINGQFCGMLTRGTTLDKLFRKIWCNPENMNLRSQRRIHVAQKMVNELNLEQVVSTTEMNVDDNTSQVSSHSLQRKTVTTIHKEKKISSRTDDPKDLKEFLHSQKNRTTAIAGGATATATAAATTTPKNRKSSKIITSSSSSPTRRLSSTTSPNPNTQPTPSLSPSPFTSSLSTTRRKSQLVETIEISLKTIKEFPDRTRLLCQLDGEMTYDPSKKDIAYLQLNSASPHNTTTTLPSPTSSLLPNIFNKNTKKTKNKKKSKKTEFDLNESNHDSLRSSHDPEEKKYLETIRIANECLEIANHRATNTTTSTGTTTTTKTTKFNKSSSWNYQNELLAIEAADPSNWDISSNNRFRTMYGNLYEEMTKRGVIHDRNRIIETKINSLCPNGNLKEYLIYLKNIIEIKKQKKKSQQQQASTISSSFSSPSTLSPTKITLEGKAEIYYEGIADVVEQKRGIIWNDGDGDGDGVNEKNEDDEEATSSQIEEIIPLQQHQEDDDEEENNDNNLEEIEEEEDAQKKFQMYLHEQQHKDHDHHQEDYDESDEEAISPPAIRLQKSSSTTTLPIMKKNNSFNQNLSNQSTSRSRLPSYDLPTAPLPIPAIPSGDLSCYQTPSERKSQLARQSTKETLNKFNSRLKLLEIEAKQAKKNRKEIVKKYKKEKKLLLKQEITSPQLTTSLSQPLLPLNSSGFIPTGAPTSTTSFTAGTTAGIGTSTSMTNKGPSFDEMIQIGKKHLLTQQRWVDKVKNIIEEDTGKNNLLTNTSSNTNTPAGAAGAAAAHPSLLSNNPSPSHHGTLSKDFAQRYQSIRLFQSMMETQKTDEEKLLTRQSFGPYKAIELLQFYDIFQMIPKKIPSDNDIVLTATLSLKEEDDAATTSSTSGRDDPNIISLHDFLKHKYLRNRPHLKAIFEKNLILNHSNSLSVHHPPSPSSSSSAPSPSPYQSSGMILITLNRILQQMCPLMTINDRKDCIKYFHLITLEREKNIEIQPVVYTSKQLKQLRLIFNYFDIDHSGTVDRNEIKKAIHRDNIHIHSQNHGLKGSDQLIETGVDDASIESMVDEADIDGNKELDFDEFVKLFGTSFQT